MSLVKTPIVMKQLVCAGCKRLLGYVLWRTTDKLKPGRHVVAATEADFQCPDCGAGGTVLVQPRMMEVATR